MGFKRLEEEGRITDIEVNTVSSGLLTAKKFTTTNGGVSVRIRSSSARLDFDDMFPFDFDDGGIFPYDFDDGGMFSDDFDDEDGDLYGL